MIFCRVTFLGKDIKKDRIFFQFVLVQPPLIEYKPKFLLNIDSMSSYSPIYCHDLVVIRSIPSAHIMWLIVNRTKFLLDTEASPVESGAADPVACNNILVFIRDYKCYVYCIFLPPSKEGSERSLSRMSSDSKWNTVQTSSYIS